MLMLVGKRVLFFLLRLHCWVLFFLLRLHCSAYLFSYFAVAPVCSRDIMSYPEMMIIVLEVCANKIMGTEPFGSSSGAFDLYAEEAHFESPLPTGHRLFLNVVIVSFSGCVSMLG
jgi:hypothetical protein